MLFILALLSAWSVFVTAAPNAGPILPPPVVTLCTTVPFSGICSAIVVNTTYDESRPESSNNGSIVNVEGVACYNVQKPFVGNLSSFSVTNGTACFLNHKQNCSDICTSPEGCAEIVQYPGYANLSTYDSSWMNDVDSFSCSPSNGS